MSSWKNRILMAALTCQVAAGAQSSSSKAEWSVDAPPGPIDVKEGTWLSLDVSPDGKTLAFDLLGDLYLLDLAGGEARPLTSGIAWDMQPRFSPDGRHIAFTSDRGGGDNRYLGMERDIGSLEPGKLADVIVVDGDPLADIRQSKKVELTVLGGRVLDSASMKELAPVQGEEPKLWWR